METKIFVTGGAKSRAKIAASNFKGFKDPATGDFKFLIELTFPGNSTMREFADFGTINPKQIANLVFFERFDNNNPTSKAIEKAEVTLTQDADEIVIVDAKITLSGGGKTQSAL